MPGSHHNEPGMTWICISYIPQGLALPAFSSMRHRGWLFSPYEQFQDIGTDGNPEFPVIGRPVSWTEAKVLEENGHLAIIDKDDLANWLGRMLAESNDSFCNTCIESLLLRSV